MTRQSNHRESFLTKVRQWKTVKTVLRQADHLLDWRQWSVDRNQQPGTQLFILGLPRSGTTLIYQYIIYRLQAAYFTNSIRYSFLWPCLGTSLDVKGNISYRSDFKNHYGTVKGRMAPHEGGEFWNRFFDKESYQEYSDISDDTKNHLRKTICCMQQIFGTPLFINKNIKHLLRIDILAQVFEDSYFLVVERDLDDVALSLLRSRKKLFGTYGHWFSVRPDNFEDLVDLDPAEQVAKQVNRLSARLTSDLDKLDPSRVIKISYSDFCSHPDLVLERLPFLHDKTAYNNAPVKGFDVTRSAPENEIEKQTIQLLGKELHENNQV